MVVCLELQHILGQLVLNPNTRGLPFPKSVSAELALACNSICRRFNALLVGSPLIGVGILYLKHEAV